VVLKPALPQADLESVASDHIAEERDLDQPKGSKGRAEDGDHSVSEAAQPNEWSQVGVAYGVEPTA